MDIIERYRTLDSLDFCLAYLDNFDDSATDALIAMQDARLKTAKKIRKKVSFLMTECFQNIIRHTEDSDLDFDKLFVVQSQNDVHNIITINPVSLAKQASLEKSLAMLENLSEAELKQVYLDSLTGNSFSSKGGAGLGLIEMFRKTKRMPRFEFYPLSSELAAFKLELDITEEGISNESSSLPVEFYRNLIENRVLIMQKSDFDQDTVISLFKLIENNHADPSLNTARSKKLYLLIELLQNMSTNTAEIDGKRTGIFQISLSKNRELILETGNCVENENALALKDRLESILNLSRIDLLKTYNKELLKGLDREDQEANAGIGLLEILKLTEGRLQYDIQPMSDSISFITFRATIEK